MEGEFDLDTVPEIDRFLRRSLGPLYHQDHLVIDLARTTFVDSSFIGFLRAAAAPAGQNDASCCWCARPGRCVRSWAIVGLPNVVPVFDTLDAAMDSVAVGRLPVIPPAFQPVAG